MSIQFKKIEIEKMDKMSSEITPILISAISIPNGEVICNGKVVGNWKNLNKYIFKVVN